MKQLIFIVLGILIFFSYSYSQTETVSNTNNYVIVVHGGAGYSTPESVSTEKQEEYKAKLTEALNAGKVILDNNGTCIDAVEAVISVLEDSPLFNAGKGAVFTNQGTNEMDASIMSGSDLNAGAVAGVRTIKNPIKAARKVMTNSKHVLLSGDLACEFAKNQDLEIVDTSYFYTKEQWDYLQKVKEQEDKNAKHGTVGCVVLDQYGNLAAGTSTGGMTNKRYGRIGDSPIIGAGTYANNKTCAVSCTGHGEYFIRWAVAHDMSAMMEYQGLGVERAAIEIILKKLKEVGGNGGLIAVDHNGNIAMVFNTPSMFRGFIKSGEEAKVFLFE